MWKSSPRSVLTMAKSETRPAAEQLSNTLTGTQLVLLAEFALGCMPANVADLLLEQAYAAFDLAAWELHTNLAAAADLTGFS